MLRQITIGQGPEEKGSRVTGFDVAVASEIMAILARATSLRDRRGPQGGIVIDTNRSGEPVSPPTIGAGRGALTALVNGASKLISLSNWSARRKVRLAPILLILLALRKIPP